MAKRKPRNKTTSEERRHQFVNQQYDKVIRDNLKSVFIPLIIRLLNLQGYTIKEQLPDKIHSIEQRETDLLLLLVDENGDEFILHVEFQTTPDYAMDWRLAEYHGLLLAMYRLPIRHCVVELYTDKVHMRKEMPEKFWFKGFDTIRLHDLKPEQFLKSQLPNEII